MKKLIKIILNNLEDVFFIIGLLIILITTFSISKIIASYLLGILFLVMGWLFMIYPRKGNK